MEANSPLYPSWQMVGPWFKMWPGIEQANVFIGTPEHVCQFTIISGHDDDGRL